MSVAQTSMQAYWSERLAFRFSAKQAVVLDNLYIDGPATRAQLEKRTGLKLCCVCGRVNELIAAGSVEEHGTTIDEESGKRVQVLRYKEKENVH